MWQAFDKLVVTLAKWHPSCIYLDLDGTSNPVLMDDELDGAGRGAAVNFSFVAPKEAIVAILDATQDLKPYRTEKLLKELHNTRISGFDKRGMRLSSSKESRKGGVDIPKPPKGKTQRAHTRKPLGIISDGNTPMRITGSKWRGSSPLMASNLSGTPQERSLQFQSFNASFNGSVPKGSFCQSFVGSLPAASANTDPEAFWSE